MDDVLVGGVDLDEEVKLCEQPARCFGPRRGTRVAEIASS